MLRARHDHRNRHRSHCNSGIRWARCGGSRSLFSRSCCFASPAWAAEHPALAKARALYNAGDFDGAISAAAVARRDPASADAAALVIARAHLERYRQRADPADLGAAREALGSVRSSALTPRDQVDLLVGLGQSLYLGEVFGAAAELFDTALSRASLLPDRDRLLLLDWWATALDREAQTRARRSAASRVFERIAERMEAELRRGSGERGRELLARRRGARQRRRRSRLGCRVAAWVRSTLKPGVVGNAARRPRSARHAGA